MERGRERARKEEDQIVRPSRRRKEKKKKKRQSNDYLVRDGGRVTAKHLELFRFTWSPCACAMMPQIVVALQWSGEKTERGNGGSDDRAN